MPLIPPLGFMAESAAANTAKTRIGAAELWKAVAQVLETRMPKTTLGRLAMGLALFFIGAMLERHLREDTAIAKVFKKVITDGPSEIMTRLVEKDESSFLRKLSNYIIDRFARPDTKRS